MADPQMLTEDNCLQILEKHLKTRDFQLKSFKILSFHNPMQGLIGEHFTLRIDYSCKGEQRTQDFFVKTLSTNPFMLNLTKTIQVYEKEALFYKLLGEFEKYGIDTSFSPKGYFFKPYITVLQDLSEKGYKGTPKRKLLDLEHCRTCLKAIAKFHASSVIYEKRKSEELGKKYSLKDEYSELLEDKFASEEETVATRWMVSSIQGLFQLIDLIPENHVSHETFKATLSELLSMDSGDDSLVSGVLHGDLWSSNFLYLYEGDKPVESKLLDYQLLKYGPLELDLVEFLMTNTTRDFRDKNFHSLIEYYYKNLSELLIRAGLECDEILAGSCEFVRSCDNFKLAGKVHAIVDHSFTFVSDEIYGDAMKSEESFRKFLFEERGKYVIESYNKSEEFKNMLREDVLELRDLLFPGESD
ncbi:EcKinase and/or DUF1679 domain containing protein [Asbolus verrucosus]|uniref:EcKinase and/or DUF1679 domain containing protein n=1 Tax=Asbolus verrucosus TaxID=1661398 RepID=A0A482V7B5_ASBVE|nr:EcKinase and/or DUF1679 domain containing protein [Asbolus verrucosus]